MPLHPACLLQLAPQSRRRSNICVVCVGCVLWCLYDHPLGVFVLGMPLHVCWPVYELSTPLPAVLVCAPACQPRAGQVPVLALLGISLFDCLLFAAAAPAHPSLGCSRVLAAAAVPCWPLPVCTFGVELWHPLFPGLLLQLCIAGCALRLQVGVGTVPGVYDVCPVGGCRLCLQAKLFRALIGLPCDV